MKKIIQKLKLVWNVLFRYEHFIVLNLNKDDLMRLLMDEDFDIEGEYIGLRPYLVYRILKSHASLKDDNDMILMKAEFEANVEIWTTQKK